MDDTPKLPKQWRNWCAAAGLKPMHGGRRQHEWFYLKGYGRYFRVNCYGHLDISVPAHVFCRWASGRLLSETLKFTHKSDFIAMVSSMLKMARSHDAQYRPAE